MTLKLDLENEMSKRQIVDPTSISDTENLILQQKPDTHIYRNVMSAMVGRGQSGKSTLQKVLIDRASIAGRPVVCLDCDTVNATMTRFYPKALRPDSAAQPVVTGFVNEHIAKFFGDNKSYIMDFTGQDMTFERALKQGNIGKMQEKTGKPVVIYQLFSPNLEHISAFETSHRALGGSVKWILCLNYGLADDGDEIRQFQAIRDHRIIRAALEGDAELVEFPRNPLIADIERLGLTFADAIAGKPGSDGTRLSDWDITRVEAWMEAVEDAFKPVQEWLL